MVRNTLASIFILIGVAAAPMPVTAASLGSLTDLVSGDALSAGLSGLGLTAEQVELATPIVEQSITKSKEIMEAYNYSTDGENDISETDLTKMKGELGEEIKSSKSMLGDFIPADTLDTVMSLVKSQLPGGLL